MLSEGAIVEEVSDPSPEDQRAIADLLGHLSGAPPPSDEELAAIADSGATTVLVARIGGRIVGTLSLVIFPLLTGKRAWIEDVVVLPDLRGRGLATALIEKALRSARDAGCRTVDLTSRPTRVEGNRLYEKLGFAIRETNVYRMVLTE